MPSKVCPRCGAQYAALKSETCPQCFAKLTEIDDEAAAELAAAQAQLEKSPEHRQAKAEEDERYRHQSFQACLLAVAMGIALIVLTGVLIVSAIHARNRESAKYAHAQAPTPPSTAPATQASAIDVMPASVDGYRREKVDPPASLSGTVSLIYHAAYVKAGEGSAIDVYAVAIDRPAAELDRFRDVVSLAAMAGTAERHVTEVSAKPFLYEIVGVPGQANVNDDFRRAWTSQVGGK